MPLEMRSSSIHPFIWIDPVQSCDDVVAHSPTESAAVELLMESELVVDPTDTPST